MSLEDRARLARPRGPFVVLAAVLSVSCSAGLLKLPSGPGGPASDTGQVAAEATSACRGVTSFTAEIGVSGSVDGRRLRARLLVGLVEPSSARVEAFAFGQQVFIMVARADEATLLLTRENRVLRRGRPAEILEAVAGVPLDGASLRTTLLGCDDTGPGGAQAGDKAAAAGRQIGDDWRVAAGGSSDLYFQRRPPGQRWRLVASLHHEPARPAWRAEYRDFQRDLPQTVRLVGTGSRRFDLRLALSQVELNPTLPPAAFDVNIPSSADPLTIEELRDSGPIPGE